MLKSLDEMIAEKFAEPKRLPYEDTRLWDSTEMPPEVAEAVNQHWDWMHNDSLLKIHLGELNIEEDEDRLIKNWFVSNGASSKETVYVHWWW